MTHYYIRTKYNGRGGSIGDVYKGATNVITQPGYVAVEDGSVTDVVLSKELEQITSEQYARLEQSKFEWGVIKDTLIEIDLRKKREEFVRAALALSEAWEQASPEVEDRVGMVTNYPFQEEFQELTHLMLKWGEEDE